MVAIGLVHAVNGAPSKLHATVPSLTVNANATRGPVVLPLPGPAVIAIEGGTVSTVHVRVAGVGSSWPAASCARTENECGP